jgi:hypothetical protein
MAKSLDTRRIPPAQHLEVQILIIVMSREQYCYHISNIKNQDFDKIVAQSTGTISAIQGVPVQL